MIWFWKNEIFFFRWKHWLPEKIPTDDWWLPKRVRAIWGQHWQLSKSLEISIFIIWWWKFQKTLYIKNKTQKPSSLIDGLNWLCYFAGSSKSHYENSISFIFLESRHQVDMKNVVKCWKDFLSYFTTLETLCLYI